MAHINRDFRTNINERIRARECRLIDEAGQQLGIVNTRDALGLAREKGLDLIEVSPNATPPVCKIMDYGKHKYEQGKREREARKKSHAGEVKSIKMRPSTDEHDFMFKLKNAQKFLQGGDKVKFTIVFRSREITHPEIARRSMERVVELTSDIAVVEKPASMEGRAMSMVLAPK
ncbi:MAG: translation initiation factor IF-3 [Armatimonadota bacterium]|nr:translation initiation factor IF-3 [Armatimonadota bacterium]